MRSPVELNAALRASGRKVTPQRELVVRILQGNETHPTAEAVYVSAATHMPSISLKTVYSVLNDLAQLGEIQVLDIGTGSSRFDPNVSDHHHLVCTGCAAVHDVHVRVQGLEVPPEQVRGFSVCSAEIVFRGLCRACLASSPTQNPPKNRSST